MATESKDDDIILLKQILENIFESLMNNKYHEYEKQMYNLFNILNSIDMVIYFNIINELFIDFINKSIKIIDRKYIITDILFIFFNYSYKYKYLLKLNTKKYILYILQKLIELKKIKGIKSIIDYYILIYINEIKVLNYKRKSKNSAYFKKDGKKFVINYNNSYEEICNFLFHLKIIKYLKYLEYDSEQYNIIIKEFRYYLYNEYFIITPMVQIKNQYEFPGPLYEIQEIDIQINTKIRKICYLFEPKLLWISSVIRAQELKKLY